MTRTRLSDVAREAGVSVSAASFALSGKNRVSAATRQRVRDAAQRLGYSPDPVSRALSGRSPLPLVGLVVDVLRRPGFERYHDQFGKAMGAATVTAGTRGYGLVTVPRLTDSVFDVVPVAGLVVIDAVPDDPYLAWASSRGIPVATDSEEVTGVAVRLTVDYGSAACLAMDHLSVIGCRAPALIFPDIGVTFARETRAGYRAWCESHGREPIEIDTTDCRQGGILDRVLGAGADGAFTVVPGVASLVRAAAARGRVVGADFGLVAFDDGSGKPEAAGVSSVGFMPERVSADVMAALIDAIEGVDAHATEVRASFALVEPGGGHRSET